MGNENQKWVLLSYIVASFLAWYVLKSFFFSIFDMIKITNYYVLGTIPSTAIIAFTLSLGLFVYMYRNSEVTLFSNEVAGELRKVTWPNKKEYSGSTLVVVIVVIIFASILGVFDLVWVKLLQILLG